MTHDRMTAGRTLSTTSTSLAKRLMMRPVGVVSNNSIGQRSTNDSMTACISLAAYTEASARMSEEISRETTGVVGGDF